MVQHRYELIAESTRRKNKLTAICDELFPEFTRLLRNPNLPTALALRSRFPTPADLAAATWFELREARGRTCSVSDAKLIELQRLAAQSIGTKDPARVRGLVIEQKQLIRELDLIGQHLAQLEAAGQPPQVRIDRQHHGAPRAGAAKRWSKARPDRAKRLLGG